VLDPGNLSLYVRIINPKGETIAVTDKGSGTIATADSDNPVQYSKKADIDWDQKGKKVVLYWGPTTARPRNLIKCRYIRKDMWSVRVR
jgi:hypothetical protein